ncbi:hypothetical protein PRIPAC_72913, partial [Pristionchus pacificus]|uniref:Uncharacterized protein n=1 Tax=Pristionchus pacificus TaxID=54126 RepID=A0A2A6C8F8_PRIPA
WDCKHCDTTVKRFGKNTTNLLNQLRSAHGDILDSHKCTQEQVDRAVSTLLIKNLLPFRLADSKEMNDLIMNPLEFAPAIAYVSTKKERAAGRE